MTTATLLPELRRAREKASARATAGVPEHPRAADARKIVALALEATEELRYTWEAPDRALAGGIEASDFREVCRTVIEALDWHLAFLGLIRRLEELVGGERLGELDAADARVRSARRSVEDLLIFASRPPKPIDWDKVREGQAAHARGEFKRINPDARGVAKG
jgi:hypothetical protein